MGILHQTTTNALHTSRGAPVVNMGILHQTTTVLQAILYLIRWLIWGFYIKPQLAFRIFFNQIGG